MPTRTALFTLGLQLCLLLPAAAQPGTSSMPDRIAGLFSGAKEDELIEPDLAFKLNVTVAGPSALNAEVIPAKGYYLYREKMRFSIKNSSGVAIDAVRMPAGVIKNDQLFGKTEVYRLPVPVQIALTRTPGKKNVTLVASYQGCHEKAGVCYPPIEKSVNLVLP